ncbi:hypothetical protein [Cupriavidus taiwanensis]|uniref:hypothetical protein n=1 Tax=Cupriavidus taiwanensis TaxID=164546 RepID=UPI0039C22533
MAEASILGAVAGASIGAAAVVGVALITNFLGELFKRYLDAKALAAALGGEIQSHIEGLPDIEHALQVMLAATRLGNTVSIPAFSVGAKSPLFDENAGKVGLLGPDLSWRVASAYETIRSFRLAWEAAGKPDVGAKLQESYLTAVIHLVNGRKREGEALVADLRQFTCLGFVRWTKEQVLGAGEAKKGRHT